MTRKRPETIPKESGDQFKRSGKLKKMTTNAEMCKAYRERHLQDPMSSSAFPKLGYFSLSILL